MPATNPGTAFRASENRVEPSRSHNQRNSIAQANEAGRKANADNFVVTARAAAAPTSNPRVGFGRSSHNRKANNPETNAAVTGKSVVARPAFASKGGVVAIMVVVATAATGPKSR